MPLAVSFIIPAFNESRDINQCLSAIKNECSKVDLVAELIVVDNGSSDNTAEIALQHTKFVHIIERGSVSSARNFGASKARNEILVFIDADVLITGLWVRTLMKNLAGYISAPLFIAGRQYVVRAQGSWIERYWFANIEDKLFNGGNILTSKALFSLIGGFDSTLKTGEDYDFCTRALAANCRYFDEIDYEAIHLGFPRSLGHFIRREYWHGEGDFKSWPIFLSSPVALIAMGYLVTELTVLCLLITASICWGTLLVGGLFVGNLALTKLRFRECGFRTVLINSALNYCYFNARAASAVRMIIYRRHQY